MNDERFHGLIFTISLSLFKIALIYIYIWKLYEYLMILFSIFFYPSSTSSTSSNFFFFCFCRTKVTMARKPQPTNQRCGDSDCLHFPTSTSRKSSNFIFQPSSTRLSSLVFRSKLNPTQPFRLFPLTLPFPIFFYSRHNQLSCPQCLLSEPRRVRSSAPVRDSNSQPPPAPPSPLFLNSKEAEQMQRRPHLSKAHSLSPRRSRR